MSAAIASIAALFASRIGLDPEVVGLHVITSAVQQRLKRCPSQDLTQYALRLPRDAAEFDELVEQLVVPETWFFRDVEPFKLLEQHARDNWLKRTQPIRVLSAPCASGEEAYSIAMTLLDAGLSPRQFSVLAMDLSHAALARARSGLYSQLSFRGCDPARAGDHLQKAGSQYQVNPRVMHTVHFVRGNLLDPLPSDGPVDTVFCRNVLIYLTESARRRVISHIDRCLAPDGLLVVGHAEALTPLPPDYHACDHAGAFAFARSTSKLQRSRPSAALPISPNSSGPRTSPGRPRSARLAAAPAAASALSTAASTSASQPMLTLALAQQQADAGQLAQAEVTCRHLLQSNPTDAHVHFLLGLLLQARCDPAGAQACFERAVYLWPQHRDALLQLAILCEHQGLQQQAANYRRRAQVASDSGASS